jgi:hypothetical membrane protein
VSSPFNPAKQLIPIMNWTSNTKAAGLLLTVGSLQFLVAVITAKTLYSGYSNINNYVSDLGVWSQPSAFIFNPSIAILGAAIIASSYFIYKQYKNRLLTGLMVVSGVGFLGVGLFPENTLLVNGRPVLHLASAFCLFVVTAVAAIAAFRVTKSPYRYISLGLGSVALFAFVVFMWATRRGVLSLGVGLLERLIALPVLVWVASFGVYLLITKEKASIYSE